MKKTFKILTTILLAFITAVIAPVHVFANSADMSEKYISDVKVGYAKKSGDAKAALDGYTILKDKNGNDVDLNKNAGGGSKTEGDMCVYLGYKTTDDPDDGITDLAVMNMKGGYKVEDYEALMDTQMKSQIIPFVDKFKAAIEEYRVNYSSDDPVNKAKAKYVHDCLNKLVDDDTGKNLGDLLLSQTKYEMGDEAYNALSDTEKKEHADILTIIAQSNGEATLLMENLITRGADTSEDTWVDRMAEVTYDDMLADTGLSPSKARQQLDKQYYDDAETILDMWAAFTEELAKYDSATEIVNSFDRDSYDKACADMNAVDDSTGPEEAKSIIEAYNSAIDGYSDYLNSIKLICVHDYLEGISYDDGTLLDFFLREQDDPTAIYPFVASLSEGQRAGLDYVSIRDLVTVALTDEQGYAETEIGDEDPVSVYEDVDREIYKPGGVALTSDAIRTGTNNGIVEYKSGGISGLTIASYVLTGVAITGLVASVVSRGIYVKSKQATASALQNSLKEIRNDLSDMRNGLANQLKYTSGKEDLFTEGYRSGIKSLEQTEKETMQQLSVAERAVANPTLCNRLIIGFTVAAIVMSAADVYLTWRDLTKKYDIDYSPMPKYIVDEKDITAYNDKGQKIVIKNQSAYYKVVPTNRNEGDKWYDKLGTANDLNGLVGKQWLSLYSVKNKTEDPILVSSLKVVVNDGNIPAGYDTGIHMFGTDSSCNLNNPLYVFNDDAPQMYVYFQRDDGIKASIAGSNFSSGYYVFTLISGIIIGAFGAIMILLIMRKRTKGECRGIFEK